ncbi:MAG: hypothetical protein HKM89_07390 [Gemmatimonadales bacterium]|nr:hypothetical protein [Gemmatimonadales bacterium]
MEDLGPLVWLAIIWFFASFLSAQKKKKQRAEQARRRAQRASQATLPAPPEATSTEPARRTAAPPATAGQGRVDPTQREGSALERMLQQLGAELGQLEGGQRGPMGRDAEVELPSAEEVEEREILDKPVRRVERTPVVRQSRDVVDRDDEAKALVQRRRAAAAERNRPLTLADHRAFDAKIRQAPAKVSAQSRSKSRFSAKQVRQAIVWREILGPPMALRDRQPDRP